MQRLNMLYPFSSLPVSSINKIYYIYFHLHSTFVHSKEQKKDCGLLKFSHNLSPTHTYKENHYSLNNFS